MWSLFFLFIQQQKTLNINKKKAPIRKLHCNPTTVGFYEKKMSSIFSIPLFYGKQQLAPNEGLQWIANTTMAHSQTHIVLCALYRWLILRRRTTIATNAGNRYGIDDQRCSLIKYLLYNLTLCAAVVLALSVCHLLSLISTVTVSHAYNVLSKAKGIWRDRSRVLQFLPTP